MFVRFILLVNVAIVFGVPCEEGWDYFEGTQSCFKNSIHSSNWDGAKSHCESFGGYLAKIETADETIFVKNMVSKQGMSTPWIGLSTPNHDCNFQWLDGTPLNSSAIGFTVEGNNPDLCRTRQYCVWLWEQHTWTDIRVMDDLDCDRTLHRVLCKKSAVEVGVEECEKGMVRENGTCVSLITEECEEGMIRENGTCVSLTTEDLLVCSPDWKLFSHSCYKVVSGEGVTHPQAEILCQGMGGHLASINTPAENDFLQTISQLGTPLGVDGQPWVGLFKENGNWEWTDGSQGIGYKWAPGEPNNHAGNEFCGQLMADQYIDPKAYDGQVGGMNDHTCSSENSRFICEKRAECEEGMVRKKGRCVSLTTEGCTNGVVTSDGRCVAYIIEKEIFNPITGKMEHSLTVGPEVT